MHAQSKVDATNVASLHPGMEFDSSDDVLQAVQDFALAQRKSARVIKQGGGHKLIACTGVSCGIFVRVPTQEQKRRQQRVSALVCVVVQPCPPQLHLSAEPSD